jgi:hypothetical protein
MANSIPPPSRPFDPWQPSAAEPWNLRRLGHLLRRTQFSATDDWIDVFSKISPAESINTLLGYDPAIDPLNDILDRLAGFVDFKDPKSVEQWWLFRMLNTLHPAQERIALFWHGHFATSLGKVGNARWMHNQIELFRHQGLGSFRDLLRAVTRDPAMLIWLDGNTNHKGKPNENYGREVMELFTLGIGHYTETDVKQLARAFTGFVIQGDKGVLDPRRFDDGEKTIFGQKGKFDADGAIDLLLSQPSAGPFLARKLLREFVHPQPSDEMVQHYGARLVALKWEIKPLLTEMLTSRLFFSDFSYRSRIKSPVELAVGAAASLGGKINTDWLRDQTTKMGQELLYPPNVKGWDGDEAWINANTVLLRFNFGLSLATQRRGEFAKPSDLQGWIERHHVKTADDVITAYGNLLLDGELPPNLRPKLLAYLNETPHKDKHKKPPAFTVTPRTINSKVRGLLHLLMSTPEYQLA